MAELLSPLFPPPTAFQHNLCSIHRALHEPQPLQQGLNDYLWNEGEGEEGGLRRVGAGRVRG